MIESINEEGYWWYPNEPAKKYPGTFKYSLKDGIRLSLSSTIEPSEFSDRKSADMLHGTTRSGEKYSLLKGFEMSSGVSSSDLGIRGKTPYSVGYKELFFNFALKGVHSNERYEKIQVKSLHFVPKFINRWFFDSSLVFEKTERFEEIRIAYNPNNRHEYELKDRSKLLLHRRLDSHPFGAGWDGDLNLNERTYISINFADQKSLDEVYEYYSAFEDFFTILFSKRSTCETISLKLNQSYLRKRGGGEEELPCYAEWLSRPRRAVESGSPHPTDIFFRFKDIKKIFGEIIDKWISKADKLKQVRQLYVSSLYSKEQYIESSVLDLSKAAEVYHRRFRDGSMLDKEQFESEILCNLVKAIPKDIDRAVMDTFRLRLSYMNEYSLNKRLKSLSSEHNSTLSLFELDTKKIIRDIVQTRNHFTHYTLEKPDEVLSFDSLCLCMDYLRLLCDVCFMSEMGFEKEEIKNNINKSQTYKWTSLRLKS